jgi:O-antigen/teichoic acid export membrane protein
MQKGRLFSNAAVSMLQVLVVSGTLFVLYKVLLRTIGVKQLGIWSLVMATGSLTQLANLGLVGGVTKFVAKYVARDESELASRVIETTVVSLALSTGIVLAVLFLFARPVLSLFIPADSLEAGLSIVPYAFISLWILLVAGVFQAGLDGYQRIDSRNIIVMIGSLIYLGLCYVLALKWGLVGVAAASVIQNLWLLVATCRVLRKHMPSLRVFRYRWDPVLFKEMLAYGAKFQLISIAIMITDPVTKVFLSRFGGLATVGYYDMCNRMVQQLRAFIVTPGFTLVPAAADLKERAAERIRSLYFLSYDLTFCTAAATYTLVIIYAPAISRLWIGHYEQSFVTFAFLLSIGWFFNVLAVPAYFINLGTGELRWNVISHASAAILNGAAGFLLGRQFGASGVVVGWVVSTIVGGVIINVGYYVTHQIPLSRLMPRSSIVLMGVCLVGVVITYLLLLPFWISVHGFAAGDLACVLVTAVIAVLLWLHPSRKHLFGLIAKRAG